MVHSVWKPDEKIRTRRDIFYAYCKAVKNSSRQSNHIRSLLSDYCVRLAKGCRLTQTSQRDRALKVRNWQPMQKLLLQDFFNQFMEAEACRKKLKASMAAEVLEDPELLKLIPLMGMREVVAFGAGAIIGEISCFANPKEASGLHWHNA
ncbi:MAG: hypothetical protein AAGA18_03715 [Verrucomicrobiota bacterium]